MTWHVFTMDSYVSGHRTYREARQAAQGTCDTNRSPKRLAPQFYQLQGSAKLDSESSNPRRAQVYIATTPGAVKQGWTEDRLRRADV